MLAEPRIRVEVCYPRPEAQVMVALEVVPGTTASQALALSGLTIRFPDAAQCTLGIAGKRVDAERVMAAGERLELLRLLTADPKEIRRQLAAQGKTMGKKK